MKRIVLAYSGDLATSAAIPWLSQQHSAEVVAVTVDLGQGAQLEDVRDRALAAGAARAHVLDAREEFARCFVLPALKSGAICHDADPLGAALGTFLVARKTIDIASIEQADAVAHGSARPIGDTALFERAGRALTSLAIVAPAREWGMTAGELAEYTRSRNIAPRPDAPNGAEVTLWSRSLETQPAGGPVDWRGDPFVLTRPAAECPDQPAHVEITFDRGTPTAINGVAMPLVELIGSLGTIAGAHGVGRLEEPAGDRRRLHEAPAAVVLCAAHGALLQTIGAPGVERFSRLVSAQYAELIGQGDWFSPLRDALDAFVDKVQEHANGVVRLRLFKGNCAVVDARTPAEPPEPRASGPDQPFGPPAATILTPVHPTND
jgi:argininosuccinate synthase